jgi:predicted small metal-binding protein
MSQNEVNEIKSHVNQIVLGSAQGYINNLRSEIYTLITNVARTINYEVETQARSEREILWVILDEVRHLHEWDESELTG